MSTVPRCVLPKVLLVLFIWMIGCDSVSPDESPAINGIHSDSEVLTFRPGESVPTATLSVDASNEDGVTFSWNASGGSFESTGTAQGAEGRTVVWQPEPLARTYDITVEAARGELSSTHSTSIDVHPRLFGNWRGEIELSDEPFEQAVFCMFVSLAERLSEYSYAESRSSGGTSESRASGGSAVQPVGEYDYPTFFASLGVPDSDSFAEPIAMTGTISADGTRVDAEIELEDGTMRPFELERTTFYCQ